MAGDLLQEAHLVSRGAEELRPEPVLIVVPYHPETLHQHAVKALGKMLLRRALGNEG